MLRGPLRAGERVANPDPGWSAAAPGRELEPDPQAPRSITTWLLVHEGALYLPSALASRKRWPSEVVADGRVVVRIEGRLYERAAARVTDPALVRALRAEAARKYGLGDGGAAPEEDAWDTWFFRLEARPGA